MLPKGEDEARKGLLQSIVSLNDNPDFEALKEYLDESGQFCAAQACVHPDDSLAKKSAGGFIAIHELKKLFKGAGEELERLKGKKK